LDDPSDMRDIDQLAQEAAMSRRSFTRHFAEQTGMSFGAWRHRVKVHGALQMLSAGTPVTEVGFSLGYASTSAFTTMFRKCVGESPRQYAQRLGVQQT
jgi:AraC-like DNA-binding protein